MSPDVLQRVTGPLPTVTFFVVRFNEGLLGRSRKATLESFEHHWARTALRGACPEKGKPAERQGRKVTGLKGDPPS